MKLSTILIFATVSTAFARLNDNGIVDDPRFFLRKLRLLGKKFSCCDLETCSSEGIKLNYYGIPNKRGTGQDDLGDFEEAICTSESTLFADSEPTGNKVYSSMCRVNGNLYESLTMPETPDWFVSVESTDDTPGASYDCTSPGPRGGVDTDCGVLGFACPSGSRYLGICDQTNEDGEQYCCLSDFNDNCLELCCSMVTCERSECKCNLKDCP